MEKRIGVVFPGYGEQFIGMGKELYDEFRIVQEYFEHASSATDINFVKLLFASSAQEISSVRYAYLAIYLFESSLYELLWQQGLRPDFVAGYGVGEYAACFAAKSLSFVDGLYFLNKYSKFYHELLQDKDYTVLKITRDFSLEQMEALVKQVSDEQSKAYISAHNTEDGFYVSGSKESIERIQQYCKEHVIRKVKELRSEYGLHSSVMDPVVDQLKLYYHKIQFKPLQVPVITNVDGVYVTSQDALQSAVVRRINKRIEWYQVMQGFEGCDIIISVGPGKQLVEWFQQLYPDKEYHVVQTLKDIQKMHDLFTKGIDEKVVAEKKKSLQEADAVNDKPSDYDIENGD